MGWNMDDKISGKTMAKSEFKKTSRNDSVKRLPTFSNITLLIKKVFSSI
jgi:hypothetical protein